MNCPQCQQPVGNDQYHISGAWVGADFDVKGTAQAMVRDIHVHCDHCGLFTLVQDHRDNIRETRLITDPSQARKISRLIPALKFDRRVPERRHRIAS